MERGIRLVGLTPLDLKPQSRRPILTPHFHFSFLTVSALLLLLSVIPLLYLCHFSLRAKVSIAFSSFRRRLVSFPYLGFIQHHLHHSRVQYTASEREMGNKRFTTFSWRSSLLHLYLHHLPNTITSRLRLSSPSPPRVILLHTPFLLNETSNIINTSKSHAPSLFPHSFFAPTSDLIRTYSRQSQYLHDKSCIS